MENEEIIRSEEVKEIETPLERIFEYKDIRGKPTWQVISFQVVAPGTNTATGDGKYFFRIPKELNGFNLTRVAAVVYTAGTTGTTDIQIRNKTQSADMLTTKITIDSGETDTSTAAAAAVIDTANDDVATGDAIAVDVDAVSTTPAQGLYIELQFSIPGSMSRLIQ